LIISISHRMFGHMFIIFVLPWVIGDRTRSGEPTYGAGIYGIWECIFWCCG